jgi:hypothetical protein
VLVAAEGVGGVDSCRRVLLPGHVQHGLVVVAATRMVGFAWIGDRAPGRERADTLKQRLPVLVGGLDALVTVEPHTDFTEANVAAVARGELPLLPVLRKTAGCAHVHHCVCVCVCVCVLVSERGKGAMSDTGLTCIYVCLSIAT